MPALSPELDKKSNEESKKQHKSFSEATCLFFKKAKANLNEAKEKVKEELPKAGCALGSGLILGGLAVLMLLPTSAPLILFFGVGSLFFQLGLNLGYFFAEELSHPVRENSRCAYSRKQSF